MHRRAHLKVSATHPVGMPFSVEDYFLVEAFTYTCSAADKIEIEKHKSRLLLCF